MDTSALTILISVVAGLLIGLAGGLWMGKRESTLVGGSHQSAQERITALEAQLQLITGQYEDVQQRYAEDQKVLTLLEPLRDQLNRVDKTVIEMERKRGEQHTLISEQLRAVVTNDEALRKTTESLESALRGGSTRGRWGEVQLRRIAESAGLQNKLDFVEQKQVDGEGLGKPDMTLHLPGDKYIAIDSKVPFSAYWDAQDIPLTATGEDASRRQRLLEPYRVDAELMQAAAADALFMHCLPAHRDEEVSADVMDGPQSVVWDEAENRLHAQKAILSWCLGAMPA